MSHLLGAGVALAAAVPLIRSTRGNWARTTAIGVYVTCVVATLAVSGTYHSLDRGGPARAFMQHIDYYAIWFLIAGTFTAVHGIMCRGLWRGGVLTFIWVYAATGILLQVLWFRVFSGVPGLLLYLVFGWVGIGSVINWGDKSAFAWCGRFGTQASFFQWGRCLKRHATRC